MVFLTIVPEAPTAALVLAGLTVDDELPDGWLNRAFDVIIAVYSSKTTLTRAWLSKPLHLRLARGTV